MYASMLSSKIKSWGEPSVPNIVRTYCVLGSYKNTVFNYAVVAEEERDVVPASSVPADPLISSSSSADIHPLESRWEPSSVDVYEGTAVPDL